MCSEKNSHDYIVVGSLQGFGPNNDGSASQTVAYLTDRWRKRQTSYLLDR